MEMMQNLPKTVTCGCGSTWLLFVKRVQEDVYLHCRKCGNMTRIKYRRRGRPIKKAKKNG
jgi:hypothetical protein